MTLHVRRSRHASCLAAAVLGLTLLVPALSPALSPAGAETGPSDTVDPRPIPAATQQIVITTDGGAPVLNRDDYVPGTMQVAGAAHRMEIRGRGNSTWGWPKKPYKIKLETDASLLGIPAETDEWVLLANYADRSALRTQVAFDLASRTRLSWAPRTRYVDVVLNGQPQGLYTLTEQVEQGSDRVDLPEGGYLLEVDKRFRKSDEPGFRTGHGIPIAFKDPDEITRQQRREVTRGVRAFERILYGADFTDPRRGYRSHIDVGTFIDWYLLEEFFRNQDSNFQSSVYITWTPGGRFALGPPWDFDLSAGSKWKSSTAPEGWYTRDGGHWVSRMLEDPWFSAQVKRRWAALRPQVDKVISRIPLSASVIRQSALADWALWHAGGDQIDGSVHADSFDGEVAFLRSWLDSRVEWLSLPEVAFARTSWTVGEGARDVRVPVRLAMPAEERVSVDYAWVSGTALPGKDFRLANGTLTFRPGETTKWFTVRLREDRLEERAESIDLALTSGTGAVVGWPNQVRLRIARSDQRP